MAGTVPNGAESILAQYAVNKTASQNLVLRLFKNNATISETTAAEDLTEATFTGYSAITLTGASWTESGGVASYDQQTFTSSADQTEELIYGAYCTRASGGELMIVEKFTSPVPISANGDNIKVTPSFTQA